MLRVAALCGVTRNLIRIMPAKGSNADFKSFKSVPLL